MMLKINDRFSVTRDARNWILWDVTHHTPKTGKNAGKVMPQTRESFFGSMEVLCKHVIDREMDPEGGFAGIKEDIHRAEQNLNKMIKDYGLQAKRILMEAAK